MSMNPTFLAIIPARGGSKRLPGKNIKLLHNKPLIAWSIEAAKQSRYIDCTVVSTDDRAIAEVARKYGAETPFLRPPDLATDRAGTVEVIEHTVQWYINERNRIFDFIILLQPTSPLRTAKHIDEAIELLKEKRADAVISVCEMDHSPLWSNTLPPNLSLDHFISPEIKHLRSQDLPTYYRINGAVYICKTEKFMKEKTLFLNDNIYAYKMSREYSIDIDSSIDFIVAEAIMESGMS